ncbi:ketopantoate reductase PanE/ApbA C terminal-domain-containing protein [Zopfochytrium polystomum]|nr:ketopantoate reductase PanE/ApbA C terminal-domain-containing protein [Zopfochytrium polystomum]
MTTTVHVLGAGAIGLLFAHHLKRGFAAANNVETVLLLRNPHSHGDACVRGFLAQENVSVTVFPAASSCSSSPSVSTHRVEYIGRQTSPNGPISTLLVCTQAHETASALSDLFACESGRIDGDSILVLLQNGVLRVAEQLTVRSGGGQAPVCTNSSEKQMQFCRLPPISADRIILGSTTHGVTRSVKAKFEIYHAGNGSAHFGPLPSPSFSKRLEFQGFNGPLERNDRREAVLDLFRQPSFSSALGIVTSLPWSSMKSVLFTKLAVNACLNPLTAILSCRNGVVADSPSSALLVRSLCAELIPVLTDQLSDAHLTVDSLADLVLDVAKRTQLNRNSMEVAVSRGASQTEADFISGYLIECAQRIGLDMPTHRTLRTLLQAKIESFALSAKHSQ